MVDHSDEVMGEGIKKNGFQLVESHRYQLREQLRQQEEESNQRYQIQQRIHAMFAARGGERDAAEFRFIYNNGPLYFRMRNGEYSGEYQARLIEIHNQYYGVQLKNPWIIVNEIDHDSGTINRYNLNLTDGDHFFGLIYHNLAYFTIKEKIQ